MVEVYAVILPSCVWCAPNYKPTPDYGIYLRRFLQSSALRRSQRTIIIAVRDYLLVKFHLRFVYRRADSRFRRLCVKVSFDCKSYAAVLIQELPPNGAGRFPARSMV